MDAPQGFPPSDFPVFFADGVRSISWSAHVVKIYFARSDPHFTGSGESHQMPHLQLVIPLDGFLGTIEFLNRVVTRLKNDGLITPQQVAFAFAPAQEPPNAS